MTRSRVKRLWILVLASTYAGSLFYAASTAPPQRFQRICLAYQHFFSLNNAA